MDQTALAATQVIEETFLSPRVVDGALLGEFAESLRGLLGQAAAQREQLRTAVAQGEAVAQSLTETAAKAREKLRPAIKLIPTIDQKLAQAEDALTRATKAAASAEHIASEAARTASAEGTVALGQARQSFDTALERARDLEARLGQLTERAEMAVEALDTECRSRLENATKHAQDVLGTLVAELDARAEVAIGRLTALLDERRAAAEAAVSGVIELGHTAPTDPQTDPQTGPTAEAPPAATAPHPAPIAGDEAASLQAATAAATEACADIETLIQSITDRAKATAAQLATNADRALLRADEAARKAAQAEELAGAAESRLESAQEQLRRIDERGREIAAGASQALAAFDAELTGRMHAVREMMEQLASVTDRHEPTGGPVRGAAATAPATATAASEIQPKGETPRFVRIDRPVGDADPGAGLPGRLRF